MLDSVEAGDAEAGEPGCSVKLGEGVALSFVDRGTIYDRQLVDMIIHESQNAEVKYQIKRTANGKTGGLHIQRSCEGVRVASIAVPVRYMHTASCVADSEDCGALKNLVYRLISAGKL